MPTTTAPPRLPDPPPRPAEGALSRALLIGAAGAAGELLGAVALGFFGLERAEALLFFALRPWVLLAAALFLAPRLWRERGLAYALLLALAAASETILLLYLGAEAPWSEAARGLLAGLGVALLADLIVQAGLRFGQAGRWAAGAVVAGLLLVPGALAPYEALTLPREEAVPTARPKVTLMSGLPLMWGEAGPFDPASRPALAYRALSREFDFVPVDTLEPATLARAPVLFLAQPQRLAPSEFVALDEWIRGGGRALILADPALGWPSELPLGDIRRPPPATLLTPLLTHWGLTLQSSGEPGPQASRWEGRKIVLERPGRFRSTGPCTLTFDGQMARCGLGRGEAVLIADADLMRDDLWAPAGPEARRRTSDNPLFVADRLDALLGLRRSRVDRAVAWAAPKRSPATGIALALPLPLAAAAAGLLLRRRRKA